MNNPFDKLPPKILEATKKHLSVIKNEQDMLYYKEWLANPAKWRIPPVSFDTFLNNRLYLGLGDRIYPLIRQTGNEIIDGKFKEGVIVAGIGCHSKGTKIIMLNGSIKNVEDINIGDKLLGHDGLERNVLKLYRGKDKMYKIIPVKGEPFVVNENHILSLRNINNEIINISVIEYLITNDEFKQEFKLWRSFKKQITLVDSFRLEPVGIDNYYGFGIDKDHLYLLGDYTVTHNSGKTFLTTALATYLTHILLCKRDPYRQYGLAKDKPITIMNMGITATQALEVAFAGIKGFIQESPWFKRFHPSVIQGKIRFRDENLILISGNSKSTTPLGYNVFCAILDEAAFYLDNDNQQVAKDIYTSLQRRVVSRFGKDGLVLMVSSPKYEDDFMMQKIEEAKRNPKIIYWKQMPTWKSKPLKNADLNNCFYFNHEESKIVDVNIAKDKKDINFVFSSNFSAEYKIWQIPGEYRSSFEQNPDKAKRDYAAMPSRTVEGFFKHREVIEKIFDERRDPVVSDFGIIRYEFAEPPLRTEYFIHIDLALNRTAKSDKAGFAMAHCAGMRKDERTGEDKKLIVVDLVESIGAGAIGEIDFEEIRNKIYTLKSIGYNIRLISLDGYQSAEFFQILNKKGFRTEYLSVDRTVEPYNMLKAVIYEDRLRVHKQPLLARELLGLEITKTSKVDHNPTGSKDLADSVTGAVFNVIKYGNSGIGMKAIHYYNNIEALPSDPALMTKEQKETYYIKLQQLIDDGMIGY